MNRSPIAKLMRNEKGIVLAALYMILAVIMVVLASFYGYAWSEHQGSLRFEQGSQAFFLAESAIDQKITELEVGNPANIQNLALGRGAFSTTYNAATRIMTGTALVNDSTRQIVVTINQQPAVAVRAAVAIQGIPQTGGTLTVDGRDYNPNGVLTGGPGVFGVSTTNPTVRQTGSSKIGGSGVAPSRPADPVALEVNAPAMANTPEAFLGLQPGALDSYKTPVLPAVKKGIIYVTQSITSLDLSNPDGTPGTGILIVHNDVGNAMMKDLRGNFKGMIITDNILHIHGVILGAVAALDHTTGHQLGNGTGDVLYSSQVLSNLGVGTVTPTSWRDLQNDPDNVTSAVTYQ